MTSASRFGLSKVLENCIVSDGKDGGECEILSRIFHAPLRFQILPGLLHGTLLTAKSPSSLKYLRHFYDVAATPLPDFARFCVGSV